MLQAETSVTCYIQDLLPDFLSGIREIMDGNIMRDSIFYDFARHDFAPIPSDEWKLAWISVPNKTAGGAGAEMTIAKSMLLSQAQMRLQPPPQQMI